jgi:hypothetical protein
MSFCILNIISLPQEVRGIFDIKAAVEMQNNLPFCDYWRALVCIFPQKHQIHWIKYFIIWVSNLIFASNN